MNYVVCVLCGEDDWDVLYQSTLLSENGFNPDVFRCTSNTYGHHPQIVKCRQCGHIYTNPRWTDEELAAAYSSVEDTVYEEEREGRVLTFSEHLRDIEETTSSPDGRALLDVGAYIGVFVEAALQAGWDAVGIEPSKWAVEVANQRDIPVFQGTLDDVVKWGRKFEVITLWDVIEHLPDPAQELAKCADLLEPGGYLVIHTMDINSRMSRIMGGKWPWLMDMHLHYFSQYSMRRMLEDLKFEIVKFETQGRHLSLGYLSSRIGGISQVMGRVASSTTTKLGLSERAVKVNFGDLFTVMARKPGSQLYERS